MRHGKRLANNQYAGFNNTNLFTDRKHKDSLYINQTIFEPLINAF